MLKKLNKLAKWNVDNFHKHPNIRTALIAVSALVFVGVLKIIPLLVTKNNPYRNI